MAKQLRYVKPKQKREISELPTVSQYLPRRIGGGVSWLASSHERLWLKKSGNFQSLRKKHSFKWLIFVDNFTKMFGKQGSFLVGSRVLPSSCLETGTRWFVPTSDATTWGVAQTLNVGRSNPESHWVSSIGSFRL